MNSTLRPTANRTLCENDEENVGRPRNHRAEPTRFLWKAAGILWPQRAQNCEEGSSRSSQWPASKIVGRFNLLISLSIMSECYGMKLEQGYLVRDGLTSTERSTHVDVWTLALLKHVFVADSLFHMERSRNSYYKPIRTLYDLNSFYHQITDMGKKLYVPHLFFFFQHILLKHNFVWRVGRLEGVCVAWFTNCNFQPEFAGHYETLVRCNDNETDFGTLIALLEPSYFNSNPKAAWLSGCHKNDGWMMSVGTCNASIFCTVNGVLVRTNTSSLNPNTFERLSSRVMFEKNKWWVFPCFAPVLLHLSHVKEGQKTFYF